jgi:ABC-type transport system substrate-binding protein
MSAMGAPDDRRRRQALQVGLAIGAAGAFPALAADPSASGSAGAGAERVLRYALPVAETGFDPAQISDLYSRIITAHIFDGLYHYDPLARPFLIKPNVTEALPQVSADFTVWTMRIKPGIHFADDPAFKGAKRELVAQDYVYSLKRFFDPVNKSPVYSSYKEEGVIGIDALRDEAIKNKTPFDYDREIEGLRALDRYTLQFRLSKPNPRFLYTLAGGDLLGAVAREVVERYGDKIMEHPVGTGPFRLAQWRRSSRIVLERNPGFREVVYHGQPNADDAEGQALAQRFKGRRLPMVDRVELNVIEVEQPRYLAFQNQEFDFLAVPLEFVPLAAPGGTIAPHLARRGVKLQRTLNPDRTLYYFNMEDPIVGGYTPDKVALRRAISLSIDGDKEIRIAWRGQAVQAQSMVSPGSWGYDPAFKTENSEYSAARAKALLDLFGYVDRDGDGWREMPDGRPLTIEFATGTDALARQFDELWKQNLDAIGIRLKVEKGQWPEQLKKARAGQLMMWSLGYSASDPDAQRALQILYGPASGGQNLARFKNERFDQIYDRMQSLPDGPERLALLREAQKIVVAYAPHKYRTHRVINDLTQPWLIGYRRPLYGNQWWQYVDIDPAVRTRLGPAARA